MLFLNYKKGTQRDVSTFYFIYSINRKMIRPVCGPFTHLGCEEGPHRSVEFTLLRTGGITSKTEIPLSGSGHDRHAADILRYRNPESHWSD